MDALRFEKPLASLKEKLARGERIFEEMLQRMVSASAVGMVSIGSGHGEHRQWVW